jgi:hypothetical protein
MVISFPLKKSLKYEKDLIIRRPTGEKAVFCQSNFCDVASATGAVVLGMLNQDRASTSWRTRLLKRKLVLGSKALCCDTQLLNECLASQLNCQIKKKYLDYTFLKDSYSRMQFN